MKRLFALVVLLLLARGAASAANKDMISLQRDVALVDDRLRTMQQTTDEKLLAVTTLLEQTLHRLNDINTKDAVLHSSFVDGKQSRQREIEELETIGAKVDRMTAEIRTTRETMADFTTRLKQVEAKLTELDNAVRIIQLPPPPPPGSGPVVSGSPPVAGSAQNLSPIAAGVSSVDGRIKHQVR